MQPESSPLSVLLWHWGRRDGGPRYTLELARVLARRPDVEVHLSLSRQSDILAEFAALGLPSCNVDTYHDKLTALLATPRMGKRICRGRSSRSGSVTSWQRWPTLSTMAQGKGKGRGKVATA